ncbi:hypothetical protein COU57_00120 [Candidatus Pacearchaeota archaeon CG10_big_fil_rev_8_21_14_0_10_32_14]|nr:MAG: hypothetical protein COU57_00120 [Candidatus Pacearchaeota archaeon CG10_big_fil_rev_8_21_14_0_10_32_14]
MTLLEDRVSPRNETKEKSYERFRRAFENGFKDAESLAEKLGIAPVTARQYASIMGIRLVKSEAPKYKIKVNKEKALEFAKQGLTLQAIATHIGCSKQRVGQIIEKSDMHEEWEKARWEYENIPKVMERERLHILGNVIGATLKLKLDEANRNDDLWPEVKAVEYRRSLKKVLSNSASSQVSLKEKLD